MITSIARLYPLFVRPGARCGRSDHVRSRCSLGKERYHREAEARPLFFTEATKKAIEYRKTACVNIGRACYRSDVMRYQAPGRTPVGKARDLTAFVPCFFVVATLLYSLGIEQSTWRGVMIY